MTEVLWRSMFVDEEIARTLATQLDIPYKIARLLCGRGFQTHDEARAFLDVRAPWSEPEAFSDLTVAANRILTAIRQHECIAIIGDYDVDGVTSSAIMATTLRALHAEYICLIPHRITDGYGLSCDLVDRALAKGAQLIVTVDNGIRAHESIDYAVSLGLDVIVTDHHEPGDTMPENAFAIVHWCRHGQKEDAKLLSGAGVAWKLCCLLIRLSGQSDSRIGLLEQIHLAYAALGALADIMPLRGENRRLVREGLHALRELREPGFVALCEVAQVDIATLNADAVLWKITPRINAAGRMDTAQIAFELFMAEDVKQAQNIAWKIETCNQDRKTQTEAACEEAKQQWVELSSQNPNLGSVVVSGPWSLGVVGIVANKLVDKFSMPAIVLSDTGEDILRGSGRAPDGFSLYQALQACAPYLNHFGGHDAAVGCGINRKALEEFRNAFSEAAISIQKEDSTVDLLHEPIADDYLLVSEATLETVDWIERFEPFGPENPPFVFYVGPVEIKQISPLQGGKHVRLTIAEGMAVSQLIWFHAPRHVLSWSVGMTIGATFRLQANVWQGKRKPQLVVQNGWVLTEPLLREKAGLVYKYLRTHKFLAAKDCIRLAERLQIDNIDLVMAIFVELGFARLVDGAYHVVDEVRPRDLRDSINYQAHLRQCHNWLEE